MALWANLAEFLLKIPPYAIINPDERGVFMRGGRYRRNLSPGFYFKWPIYDEVKIIPVKEQVINLPNQSVTTKDGKQLALSGAIRYEVDGPSRALLNVLDYDTSLQNLAMSVLASFVSRVNADRCDYDTLCKEVLEELQSEAENWGLEVMDFWLTDFVEHKVYRIMTHDTPIILDESDS